MADSYESVMNFGISAYYSPNVGEEEFSEVHIHHPEYPSLSGWCYAAFSHSHG
jgi:hypothetical protein